jgi:hypothetical protein
MEVTTRRATPWHLWVVGLLALLFTAYGAYDYLMTQAGNIAYISAASEPWGMDPQVAMAYFDSFPVWADAIWAVGVWSGVAGALLLLARSRYAYPVLILSLAGLVIDAGAG